MKQSDWPRSISERTGFLHPIRSETARCEMQLPALGIRAKNRGEKQFLNEKICQKRLKT
jgi:hypothetical protein